MAVGTTKRRTSQSQVTTAARKIRNLVTADAPQRISQVAGGAKEKKNIKKETEGKGGRRREKQEQTEKKERGRRKREKQNKKETTDEPAERKCKRRKSEERELEEDEAGGTTRKARKSAQERMLAPDTSEDKRHKAGKSAIKACEAAPEIKRFRKNTKARISRQRISSARAVGKMSQEARREKKQTQAPRQVLPRSGSGLEREGKKLINRRRNSRGNEWLGRRDVKRS